MKKKRIVIKVGSSTLTHDTGLLNLRKIEQLSMILSDLANQGNEVILVSSGAQAAGRGKLRLDDKPHELAEKQAVASIGQCELMYVYDKFFQQFGKTVAQILMTKRVIVSDQLRQNATITIETLLKKYKAIPIINENDSVATDEIVYGDNDTLSAITAKITNADLLIILSDIDGLYDKNPNEYEDAKLISRVEKINDAIENMAGDTNSDVGTGGMITKIQAAKIATEAGCDMIICNGKDLNIIYDIMDKKIVGTLFVGKE